MAVERAPDMSMVPEPVRLNALLVEKKKLRLRLAEVESELEALLVSRAATGGRGFRHTSDRLSYRTAEIAKLMGISEMTVVRAIDRGDLRAVKLDPGAEKGVRIVRATDLDKWLESRR